MERPVPGVRRGALAAREIVLWTGMKAPENLLANLPAFTQGESCETLLERTGVRIERIVSRQAASPEGFWYDQEGDEWVLVVKGEARLHLYPEERVHLKAGDHVLLPARCRHRVEWTSEETIWLAVHLLARSGPSS